MSEYQWVAFRAIDGPVSAKNLEYMEKQSSRAEISPWEFEVEYHYSEFHGNAVEMLRRGYDIHLNYSNYGGCELMIRLPSGLPDVKAARSYFVKDSFEFIKDPKGSGGILSLKPFYELEDESPDVEELLEELIPLRAEIMDGDLRPLYLAHLVVAFDENHDPDETLEGPVPAGLTKPSDAQVALLELYGMSDHLITAAARKSPPAPVGNENPKDRYATWIQRQSEATKNVWLAEILADPDSTTRREIITQFQQECPTAAWPVVRLDRTIRELMIAEDEIAKKAESKSAVKAVQDRKKKLAKMAADPASTIRETERLVDLRGTESYLQIALLLAELREALAGTEQSGLPEQQARKLKESNPTLHGLTGALRREGFVPK